MEDRLTRTDRDAGEAWALVALASLLLVTAFWWSFALWPLDDGALPLLERARAVCFGTDRNAGLPDATGWALLVGQPVLLGSFLMIVWGDTVRRALRRLVRSHAGQAGLAATATFVLVGFTLVGWRVSSVLAGAPAWAAADFLDEAVAASVLPRLEREAPPLELASHRGAAFSLTEMGAGRPVLLTFAYGHCATICPLVVRNAREAARLSEPRPVVVVVTLDPWRDVPSRLPGIAEAWGLDADDHWLLGGDPERVEATLDVWEVPRTRDSRTGEIVHPALTYVLDREGRIAFASRGSVPSLVALLERL